ncbi:putative malic enzyme [Trypanosoma cruzi]|uniref:Malic enzyme n=2 Tax=Trypanosoma cruzi TaxID=5693 RepID=Q4DJ69_TRYCC|nr:malic enzyme, putative [Trypanosoma cruzi]EAN92558.1 malic enzyme, putative [Trypanosoma cruzi]PWV19122.1 putative malic enzyme [Trypanosoma cruzi]RNC47877.1 putative mitochondrial malic enzyme [Trypanosoma cruzi]|eukprot:XP_814409.1 malic enzyme [Trypanosoma cruzi strain CL Brener]
MLARTLLRFEKTGRTARGVDFLRNRFTNKASAFTRKEREHLGVVGLLPPAVESIDDQVERVWVQFNLLSSPINRYQLLRGIMDINVTLFYKFVQKHIKETLPVIYTPTVGEACERYGAIFMRDHGLYVSMQERGNIRQCLKNLRKPNIDIMVVTDGSRILGLGDLGANGMGISIGKCSLYVAGAGIRPSRVLPVMLDVGTNNEKLRNDPLYLGQRTSRAQDREFYELLDEFMEAASAEWPNAVIQFEDFSNNHCFDIMERYQKKYRCFNDDIQGTGAVIAAGFLNAMHVSGVPVNEQRVVFLGAGSAATGVAEIIAELAALELETSVEKVRNSVYLVDSKGLVTTTRGDELAPHKVPWARTDIAPEQNESLRTLTDVVRHVRPTALIGLAAAGGAFTEEMIKYMASYCKRPILFPLSNPSSKSEVNPDDAYKWTNGTAIVASGSPFPSSVVDGKVLSPAQGNNLYIFPGVGLGCVIAQSPYIPQEVFVTAALALSRLVDTEVVLAEGKLYPSIDGVRNVSMHVAVDVIEELQRMGLAKSDLPRNKSDLTNLVKEFMWEPQYLEPEYYLSKRFD